MILILDSLFKSEYVFNWRLIASEGFTSDSLQTTMLDDRSESEYSLLHQLKNPQSIESAFLISIFLLIVASLLKYCISKETTREEWYMMAIEFPIDLCLVVLTLVVTLYLGDNVGWGIFMTIVTILVMIVCCICRRLAIKYNTRTETCKKVISWVCYIVSVIGSVIYSLWIYHVIV